MSSHRFMFTKKRHGGIGALGIIASWLMSSQALGVLVRGIQVENFACGYSLGVLVGSISEVSNSVRFLRVLPCKNPHLASVSQLQCQEHFLHRLPGVQRVPIQYGCMAALQAVNVTSWKLCSCTSCISKSLWSLVVPRVWQAIQIGQVVGQQKGSKLFGGGDFHLSHWQYTLLILSVGAISQQTVTTSTMDVRVDLLVVYFVVVRGTVGDIVGTSVHPLS